MNKLILTLFLTVLSFTVADSAFALGGGGGGGGGWGGGGGGGGSFFLSPAPATSGPSGGSFFLSPAPATPSSPITMFTTTKNGQPNNPNNPITTPQPGQVLPPSYFSGPPSGVPGPTPGGTWVATGTSADGSQTTWTWVVPNYSGSGVVFDCTPTYSGCASVPNSCGMTNTGTRNSCTGVCSAVTPAESLCCVATSGNACTSASNTCGMTSQGTISCTGVCSATTPSDSLCRTCTSDCDRNSQVCAGTSYTVKDSCGNDVTCTGTRSCDYNWKEVAP